MDLGRAKWKNTWSVQARNMHELDELLLPKWDYKFVAGVSRFVTQLTIPVSRTTLMITMKAEHTQCPGQLGVNYRDEILRFVNEPGNEPYE